MSYIEVQSPQYDQDGRFEKSVIFKFLVFEYVNCECGKYFQTEELLKEHLNNTQDDVCAEKLVKEYQCMQCSKSFLSRSSCSLHVAKTHDLNKGTGKRKLGTAKALVSCDVCGKKFSCSAFFRSHYRTHTGDKPFSCHLCPKKFALGAALKIHINTHTGAKPHQCKICSKGFCNPSNLLRHQLVHTGERPHSCDLCDKSYQQSTSLKEHIQIVHMKMPPKPRNRTRPARKRHQESDSE